MRAGGSIGQRPLRWVRRVGVLERLTRRPGTEKSRVRTGRQGEVRPRGTRPDHAPLRALRPMGRHDRTGRRTRTSERRRNHDSVRRKPKTSPRPEHISVLDVRGARHHGVDQGEQFAAGQIPVDGSEETDRGIDEALKNRAGSPASHRQPSCIWPLGTAHRRLTRHGQSYISSVDPKINQRAGIAVA